MSWDPDEREDPDDPGAPARRSVGNGLSSRIALDRVGALFFFLRGAILRGPFDQATLRPGAGELVALAYCRRDELA